MLRNRLAALAIVATLIAPWAAPCFASAPDPEMPCCPAHASDGPLQVRPCCAPADSQPVTPAGVAFSAMLALPAPCSIAPYGGHVVPSVSLPTARLVPRGIRPPSTVLLI